MQTVQTPYAVGFPISIEDIVRGNAQILCRLAWQDKQTGEEKNGFWETLKKEAELCACAETANDNCADGDFNWIEYGYSC